LFLSSNRKGRFDLYRLEIESGEAVQITGPGGLIEESAELRDCNLLPSRNEAFWRDGDSVCAVHADTLEIRCLFRQENRDGQRLTGTPSFTKDGKRYVIGCQHADGTGGILVADVQGGPPNEIFHWSHPTGFVGGGFVAPSPRFVVATGNPWGNFQGDPQAPPDRRACVWRLDVATGEFAPYLVVPPGFRATHSYWGPDARLYFHKKSLPTWTPTWICSINLDGAGYREHFGSADRKLGHSCVSPDARWLITDVQQPNENELYRIDLETGRSEVLCWPNSSVPPGNEQHTHVHPVFGYDGRLLAYQSEVTGMCSIYLLPMEDAGGEKRWDRCDISLLQPPHSSR
jgi:hypothetical protein